jgi:hypothetical protein
MKEYLQFKAGRAVIETLRDEGLDPAGIRVFAGPAGGPKWFVSVGFDRALMRARLLERSSSPVVLAGSSAGAWRCLAMACKDPLAAYEKLRIAYSRNVFTAQDTPATVSAALRRNVESFIGEDDIPHLLDHPHFQVMVHAVRAKGPCASEVKRIQGLGLIGAAALNLVSHWGMDVFFQRVIFYSGGSEPEFVRNGFSGAAIALTAENLRLAALATGSLPYIIAGVKDIPGGPRGVYRDGGLTDYQLNQDYHPGPAGLTLFFHYQERIVPGWFDKVLKRRRPPEGSLDRVLQVYPGPDFVKLLPDQRIPDRQDFVTFVDNPSERIRRWDAVSELSEILGEEFLNAVESRKIRELVRPLY